MLWIVWHAIAKTFPYITIQVNALIVTIRRTGLQLLLTTLVSQIVMPVIVLMLRVIIIQDSVQTVMQPAVLGRMHILIIAGIAIAWRVMLVMHP